MQDKCGQEITVGSYLAYGHALGRCAGIRIGKVLAIVDEQDKDYKGEPAFEKRYKGNGQYDTVPKWKYRITVIGVDDDWSHRPIELQKHKGTLLFPERTIVLKSEQVPEQYRRMLDDYDA